MRNGEQTIRDALKKAQAVLCQYLEPDGPNENQTVKQLFGILNDPDVIRALEDLKDPADVASLALKDSLPPKLRGTLSFAEGLTGGRAKRRRNKDPLEGESYVSPSLIGV